MPYYRLSGEDKISFFQRKIRSLLCRHRVKIFTGRYKIEHGCVPLYAYALSAEFHCHHCGAIKWKSLPEKEINAMGKSLALFSIMYNKEVFKFTRRVTTEDYISANTWDNFFSYFPDEIFPFEFENKN